MEVATRTEEAAAALLVSVGLLRRRLRQARPSAEMTLPELSALARLERGGPTTAAALARLEQISPQSMGATIAALEGRGLIRREPDPADGRRAVITVTDPGRQELRSVRDARAHVLADALSDGFTPEEIDRLLDVAPLIERLAQSL